MEFSQQDVYCLLFIVHCCKQLLYAENVFGTLMIDCPLSPHTPMHTHTHTRTHTRTYTHAHNTHTHTHTHTHTQHTHTHTHTHTLLTLFVTHFLTSPLTVPSPLSHHHQLPHWKRREGRMAVTVMMRKEEPSVSSLVLSPASLMLPGSLLHLGVPKEAWGQDLWFLCS